jgi:preprotein translocase subunit YajC
LDYNWIPLMTGNPDAGGGTGYMLVWFAMIFGLIYMTMIRPQRKKQKEHKNLLSELKKGDRVVTNGGLFGVIFAIDEDKGQVVLKTDGETKLRYLKTSIAAKIEK